MPRGRAPLPDLPNLALDYASASTHALLCELELLEFYLDRYPHTLARRNTAVAAVAGWWGAG